MFNKGGASAVSSANGTLIKYTGKISHIFFHSLVIYPELAFTGDTKSKLYEDYMITQPKFTDFLNSLYKDNFILINLTSLYHVDEHGNVVHDELYLPKGKKPLIISLDDLNYYSTMKGRGFADKLVLGTDGNVATEVITPSGATEITRNGDVVPILDDFVKAHSDFSLDGAKGTIAVTGFEGLLGYRTEAESPTRLGEIEAAKKIVKRLKETGWLFASHSYSHAHNFQTGSITLGEVKADSTKWKDEVGSIVGPTDIFIGPFGQIFKPDDPRREYLVSEGYKMLCGVGVDFYLNYNSNYVAMDRADIDGYRLSHDESRLDKYLNVSTVVESLRNFFIKK